MQGDFSFLLAEVWGDHVDPAGYWISEKLDGVRACWNGSVFVTREGNALAAPDWFSAGLPDEPLDGELWIARGTFDRLNGIVHRAAGGEAWRDVRFMVFDAPGFVGRFEDRLSHCRGVLGAASFAAVHEHLRCESLSHFQAELDRVVAAGGEGLMLRESGSAYVRGRSSVLMKAKPFRTGEAEVIGYRPGKGRNEGVVGSLHCKLGSGKKFYVSNGLSDEDRRSPPQVGSRIAFLFQELTANGIPRIPVLAS